MRKSLNKKFYRNSLAKTIIKQQYSFSGVELEGNREIHTYFNNEVRTITRNIPKANCLKLYAQLEKQLKSALLALARCISLTCDMWTSCQTKGGLCLTIHYVDSDWKLTTRVLNFHNLEPPHTRYILCSVVCDLL